MPTTKEKKTKTVQEVEARDQGKVVETKSSKQSLMVPLAIVIAGLFVGGAIVYSNQTNVQKGTNTAGTGTANNNVPTQQAPQQAPTKPTGGDFTKYIALAGDLNLDESEFKQCIEAFDTTEVKADLQYAGTVGASGTPTFFIGVRKGDNEIEAVKVVGAQPLANFSAILDELLATGSVTGALAKAPSQDGTPAVPVVVSLDDDAVKGNKDAKVVLLEFSDYECPFCKRFFDQTSKTLMDNYVNNGKVAYVFRDLPLSFHDPIATEEAVAANCARAQGGDEAYFNYHDALFTKTQTNGMGLP